MRAPEEALLSLTEGPEPVTIKSFQLDTVVMHLATTKPVRSDDDEPPCPFCGGEITDPKPFNLMFKTTTGAVEDPSAVAYLRPETAQGIFTQFWNVLDSNRVKVPFGIAQIGKAFRNEVTPRNFTFRSREFEQMELEFFISSRPGSGVVPVLARHAVSLVAVNRSGR